jgi:uncharacterized protein (TIGR02145 family)
MKEVCILSIVMFLAIPAGLVGQVSIGTNNIHDGAILDLTNPVNLGLKLPVYNLQNLEFLQVGGETNTNVDITAVGMIVYNGNENLSPDGKGLYVWDGDKWNALTPKASSGGENCSGSVQIGNNTYNVLYYPSLNLCWMTDNSKEGNPVMKRYGYKADGVTEETILESESNRPSTTPGQRGYYYTRAEASAACPAPWSLPSDSQFNDLMNYIFYNANATNAEKSVWTDNSTRAGAYTPSTLGNQQPIWGCWGVISYWWTNNTNSFFQIGISGNENSYLQDVDDIMHFSVRCVKSN